ncbi:DUF6318 family protein [Glutamicibacter sp. X7]
MACKVPEGEDSIMRNGRMSVIGALVVASAVLTACQGATSPGESSAPPPSSSAPPSSPTPSASPSPTPKHADENGPGENMPVPKLPDAAKEHTEEGAAAFVEFYFDLATYSIEMRDTTELEKYTKETCKPCGNGIIEPIWRAQDEGLWEVGVRYSVSITNYKKSSNGSARVYFLFKDTESKIYDRPGHVIEVNKPLEKALFGAATLEFEDSWSIRTMEFEDSDEQ